MSTTSLHTLYAVAIDGGASPVLIDEITEFGIAPEITRLMQGVGGDVEPKFVSVMEQKPRINFTTLALARALGAVGASGAAIAASPDHAVLYWQKWAQDGQRAGATSHLKMEVNAGIVVPRRLTARQGGYAQLEYELYTRYDGTNEPMVLTANQSLAYSPAADEIFTVGPVNINGTAVPGVKEITIDFGLNVVCDISGGDVWPTFCAIEARANPLVTIRCVDIPSFATLGLDGVAQGATDSVVYFRKKANGHTNVADATAEHIAVSIDLGHIAFTDGPSSSHPTMAEGTITIAPIYDGSNDLFAISTASAIS